MIFLQLHLGAWGGWDLKQALTRSRLKVFLGQALPATISPVLEQVLKTMMKGDGAR
jgi:hypothetical protein